MPKLQTLFKLLELRPRSTPLIIQFFSPRSLSLSSLDQELNYVPIYIEYPSSVQMSPMSPLSLRHEDDENSSSSTHTINPLDPEEFRRQGHLIIDFLADYYQNIQRYPVLSQVEPGYLRKRIPNSAPHNPEPIETVLHDVQMDIIPGLTHWQSPNFFGYFQSNASTAGILGELLCSGFNVVGFNWMSSPAATELESIVMDWLGGLLNLPKSFLFSGTGGGVLHGSTCEAVLCTLIAARDSKLKEMGRDNIGKLVVYGSDQTHPTLKKAAQMAGIHPANFRAIPTTKSDGFRLSPATLRSEIESDLKGGLIPVFLCATVGATASGAADPLGKLSEVAQQYGMWVHVDAAYAGSACICPEFRHFIDGVENVNSFSFNPHKWLLTGMDCCCLWVNDTAALVNSLSTDSEILRNKASDSKQVVDYKDWQIALSRRFRAMKLWLVLRSHGASNLRKFIRGHVKMARHFEVLVGRDKRFEVVTPRNFSLVCFRVVPRAMGGGDEVSSDHRANELNGRLLETVNASGQAFMTHAVIGGVYVLRLAVGATMVDFRHVNNAWKLVQQHATALITTMS